MYKRISGDARVELWADDSLFQRLVIESLVILMQGGGVSFQEPGVSVLRVGPAIVLD